MSAGAVVSVIPHLHGGAGRVLVDAVRALEGRDHLVLCGDAGEHTGLRLDAALRARGARVGTVDSLHHVHAVIRQVRPACVLAHWWQDDFFAGAEHVTREVPWIAVGHTCAPMPLAFDSYVVLSAFQGRRQPHLPPERTFIMSNGVDLRQFRGANRAAGPVTIAMVSRLERGKFPRRLIDHLPTLDALHTRVVIAGRGPRRYEIEPELTARGIAGHVRFVGGVRPSQVPVFLGRAHIGLHLTETSEEVCPLAVLEMLAAGLPIVAEPKGCLPELVVPGENGFLGETPDEIATHLRRLIEEPGLRHRLGAASRRTARLHSLDRFARSIRQIVATVCNTGGTTADTPRRRRSTDRTGYRPIRPEPTLDVWRPARSVLVCGSPRSGSGLMCEALWNTGLAGRPVSPVDFGFDVPSAPVTTAAIARAIEDRTTPNGVFTAAFSLARIEALFTALSSRDDGGADRSARLHAALPDPRFVWVVRRDTVGQAISWVRALQSGVWTQTAETGPIACQPPVFDAAAIASCLREIAEHDAAWRRLFQSLAAAPIVVVYEDLVRDYEGSATRVLAALGISRPRHLVFGSRRLIRQADGVTDRWVRRFRRMTGPAATCA